MANAVRQIVAAAANALQEDEDDDFAQVVSQTRRSFRRNSRIIRRGRRGSTFFKKKTLLLRRANSDYYPIRTECDMLTSCGLGIKEECHYELDWNRSELEEYICGLYETAPLELVGFKLAKMDRQKQLITVDFASGRELKDAIGQSQIIIIPNRDLPINMRSGNHSRTDTRTSRTNINSEIHENSTSELRLNRRPRIAQHLQTSGDNLTNRNETEVSNIAPLHANNEIILSQDFGLTEGNITNYLNFIVPSLPDDAECLTLEISRSNCLSDVFNLYKNENIVCKNLAVTFIDEIGIDGGGLKKEMFNLFFGEIENSFFKGEECIVPFISLNRVRKDSEKFIYIGRAIEHMLLLTGNVPAKLSRVTLFSIAHPDKTVNADIILEDFFLFVNACERSVLKKAINSFSDLNAKENEILSNIFHTNHFFELPSRIEIKDQILSIATDVLYEKPKQFIMLIRQGISFEKYSSFWQDCDFTVLLDLQKPTADKIVNCLKTHPDLTNEQTTILHYLEMYIRCIDSDTLRQFLFFITSSFQMPDFIQVNFNNSVGLSRRPIISTCANSIELSTNYATYQELKKEINSCLFNEEAYVYNSY